MKIFISEPKDRYTDNYKGIDFAKKYGDKLLKPNIEEYLKSFMRKYFTTDCIKILDMTFEYGNSIQFTYFIKNHDGRIGRPFGGIFDPESFNKLLIDIEKIVN